MATRRKSRAQRAKVLADKAKRRSAPMPKRRARKPKTPEYDPRFEMGLKAMRNGESLAGAARKISVSPKRLRRYVTRMGVVDRRDGQWVFNRDRRFRQMPVYSTGKRIVIMVHNSVTARHIGQYMNAVKRFFETEDLAVLAPFHGQSVRDVLGKRHTFETRPNVLFRLDASGMEPFELVYAIGTPT